MNNKQIIYLNVTPTIEPISNINDFPCEMHKVLYVSYGYNPNTPNE